MKKQLFFMLLIFNSLNILCQDNGVPNYVSTTIPADSRFELVQSNLAASLTLKIDKYTGDTYQLAVDSEKKITFWMKLVRIKHEEDNLSISNVNKVNYQFFTSGIGIRFTFLMNINTGATWQLVIDENKNYLWEPII